MKILRKANGDQTIKMSRVEWEAIGKMAQWDPEDEENLGFDDDFDDNRNLDAGGYDDIEDLDDPLYEDEIDPDLDPDIVKQINEIDEEVRREIENDENAGAAQQAAMSELTKEEQALNEQEARIEALKIREEEARLEREKLEREQMRNSLQKEIELARKGTPIA